MITWQEITLRMLLAVVVGGLIGWEREAQGKPAGFRTLMLVSLATAIYVLAAQQMALKYGEPLEPLRAMAGIAGGVGFLGAGAILQSRGEVLWLTTAAALWAAAALGMASGMGMYYIAALGGGLVYGILRWMAPLEKRWRGQEKERRRSKKAKRAKGQTPADSADPQDGPEGTRPRDGGDG